jgi:hypothetical protein
MHAVIRKYTASPAVAADARPKLAHLEQTMRQTPGFVAYYFLETDDGIATITITEDATGTQESMSRAANWVQQNLPNSGLGAPEVIRGEALINATRERILAHHGTDRGREVVGTHVSALPSVSLVTARATRLEHPR